MKVAVVTGSSRGIGLEFCRQLKDQGYKVWGLCRQASAELKKLDVEIIEDVDVRDQDKIKKATRSVGDSVDLLVNDAGVLRSSELGELDFEGIQEQFQVNTLGPLRVTEAFLPHLQEGAKVAMVTSRMGSIADNSSGGSYGYRISKAGLNALGVSLALDLKPRGICVFMLHPGWVRTDMTGHNGQIEPQESVSGMLKVIEGKEISETGTFWHTNGERLPW